MLDEEGDLGQTYGVILMHFSGLGYFFFTRNDTLVSSFLMEAWGGLEDRAGRKDGMGRTEGKKLWTGGLTRPKGE